MDTKTCTHFMYRNNICNNVFKCINGFTCDENYVKDRVMSSKDKMQLYRSNKHGTKYTANIKPKPKKKTKKTKQ